MASFSSFLRGVIALHSAASTESAIEKKEEKEEKKRKKDAASCFSSPPPSAAAKCGRYCGRAVERKFKDCQDNLFFFFEPGRKRMVR